MWKKNTMGKVEFILEHNLLLLQLSFSVLDETGYGRQYSPNSVQERQDILDLQQQLSKRFDELFGVVNDE